MHGRARSVCGTQRTDGQTDKGGEEEGRGVRNRRARAVECGGRQRRRHHCTVTNGGVELKEGTDGRTSTPHCVRWMARILRIGGRGEGGRAQISHICAATAQEGERGRRQWDCSKNGVVGRLFEVEGGRRCGGRDRESSFFGI